MEGQKEAMRWRNRMRWKERENEMEGQKERMRWRERMRRYQRGRELTTSKSPSTSAPSSTLLNDITFK